MEHPADAARANEYFRGVEDGKRGRGEILGPPPGLPLPWSCGPVGQVPLDVSLLTDAERKRRGLAHDGSIVEVIGTEHEDGGLALVAEACTRARTRGITTLDLETGEGDGWEHDDRAALDPFKAKIVLCQLGDRERQYLLWWQTLSPAAKDLVRDLWTDPEVRKAGVNLKFDHRMVLVQEGLDWHGERLMDAQIFDQLIGCGLLGDVGLTMKLTGMGMMAKRWLGWDLPKDEDIRTGWARMTPGVWYPTEAEHAARARAGVEQRPYAVVVAEGKKKRYYAADDCVVPERLIGLQAPWLKEFGLIEPAKQEMEFLPVLARMEVEGLGMDWPLWQSLSEESAAALIAAEAQLDQLFDVTVTTRIAMDGTVEVTRDKNYGSKDELKDLIRDWMFERYGVEVVGNNAQLKAACLRGGMNPNRAEKLFEQKLVPNPEKPGSNKQVGYPGMTDYIEGSEFVESVWSDVKRFLPENSFALPTTDSKFLKLLRILHETDNDLIDDLPNIPTKLGLPPELVTPILEFRSQQTKCQRYGFSWKDQINPVSGRIHTDTTQCASDTTRLTTRPNFQNFDSDPRYRQGACTARKGYKIVSADLSQIEPRIIAEISLSPMYMRIFWSERPGTPGFAYWCGDDVTEELDLYGGVGATMGIMPKEGEKKSVAKDKGNVEVAKGRKKSKISVLGLGFGTQKAKFHIMFILDTGEYHTRAETDEIFDGFWGAAAEVQTALDEQSNLAYPGPDEYTLRGKLKQRASPRAVWHPFAGGAMGFAGKGGRVTWSESIGGHKRFFDADSTQWWTQGRNHPIQCTSAEILKESCIRLARWMRAEGIDGYIILTAHDEIVCEVREDQAEIVARKMEQVMSEVGESYCPHVPISAEAEISDFWIKG